MKHFHSTYRIKASQVARKVLRPKILRRSLVGAFVALLAFFFLYESVWQFRDRAPARGAATTRGDARLGDRSIASIKYLEQGWTEGESAWFYTVTQGSDLVPYSFFVSLELAGPHAVAGQRAPFASAENYERWRYLEQTKSATNPDALPVGFTHHDYQRRNESKSRDYLGLTCAACHTGQVNYHGVAIRIDGGPSMADFETFTEDLLASLRGALQLGADGRCNGEVCKRFVAKVLARGDYDDELEVTRDLSAAERRCAADFETNRHEHRYGYARLDAFGRIYNRVLGRVLRKDDLADILPDAFDANELPDVQKALAPVIAEGASENEVIERALPLLNEAERGKLLKVAFNPSSAPVSYPFLWDIPQHDYVQWNGIVANAALGAVGRNTGEVIGVFATLDWQIESGFTPSAAFSGQKWFGKHISYRSSVYVHNLRRIERQLGSLMSPVWPKDVLGALKSERLLPGKVLFAQHCQGCHSRIDRSDPARRVVANMTSLSELGTDPQMAENSVKYTGYSGMLRNQYVDATAVGSLLLDRRAPVAGLLTKAARGVVAWPYPSANVLRRGADWASDLVIAFLSNEIQPSLKNGEYEPDTTAKPFESLLAYKGRSLNGIWATAPFLHNGSVPTLYDLLLPAKRDGDPEGEEYRPNRFLVGSRELDTEKVGFVSQGYDGGFVFDTTLQGNSNAGHEYGTIHDPRLKAKLEKKNVEQLTVKDVQMQAPPPPDDHFKPLTRQERYELVEYLKSL